jgi:short-subunit dehydrogenase
MKKNIVVSGGTKGIGRAIVEKFVENDFLAIICARSRPDDLPENTLFFQADLSIKEEVLAFAAFIKKQTNQVDVLINNAGFFLPGQVHNEADGVLEAMINTNLYSAYNLTRAVVGGMIAAKSGHIFTICSTASITAYTNGGSYCISKFALLGMNKVLREELKPYQIRVTSVLPGATFTDSWQGAGIEEERFMKPTDVADVIWTTYQLSKNTVIEEILIRPQLGDL